CDHDRASVAVVEWRALIRGGVRRHRVFRIAKIEASVFGHTAILREREFHTCGTRSNFEQARELAAPQDVGIFEWNTRSAMRWNDARCVVRCRTRSGNI